MRVLTPVNGCADCPLCCEEAFCQHPDKPPNASIWEDGDNEPAPQWCPLRKGELLVQLRGKP